MRILNDFIRGPGYLWQGFALLRRPGLRVHAIAPVVVNITVILGLLWLFGNRLDVWLNAWLAGLPHWLGWLETLLWWFGLLVAIVVFCYCFTLLANLIASPFNGLLSARTERLLTGREPESGMSLMGEIGDAFKGELHLMAYNLRRVVVLGLISLVLFFLPPANTLIPALWFILSARMLALEYLDNPMGNRGMPFADKIRWVQGQRWTGLGFGSAVTVFTAIPLANLVVMPAAVVGATAMWVDRNQGQDILQASKPPTSAAINNGKH